MSDSDVKAKYFLVKYRENNQLNYMHRDTSGNIVGKPEKINALMFTTSQVKKFINHVMKNGFPFQCGPEAIK